jgi:hypothetical protein
MSKEEIIKHFMRGECDKIQLQFADCQMLYNQMQNSMKGVCKCKHNGIRQKYRQLASSKITTED